MDRLSGGGGYNGSYFSGNSAYGKASTIGGGVGNSILTTGTTAFIGGGFGNTASGHDTVIGGGYSNKAFANESTIGGGLNNTADILAYAATIAGGQHNTANGGYTTIGGGEDNVASNYATIAGGKSNTANGGSSIGGGEDNTASGSRATIGGGYLNYAGGPLSTVPGGFSNGATMTYTFAAGYKAWAQHQGTFVWGDSTEAYINSSGDNQFIVRANGGIWLGKATSEITPTIGAGVFISTSTGANLTTGGAWTNSSDRNAKTNFTSIDARDILNRVAGLPIQGWNYKVEDAAVRHIGPMAQDFYAAFNVGQDDAHITTIDESGVALAAIQGLYQQNQDLKAQVEALKNQTASPASFNLFNLLSVIALVGFAYLWLQQRRSKRGQA